MHSRAGMDYYTDADKLLLAVDCIIFGFDKNTLKLLLFKRRVDPFVGRWSLIGSFVQVKESVSDAAKRVLQEYTGLESVFMEVLNCYGQTNRDPGGRVVSIPFYALIRIEEQDIDLVEQYQARWFAYDEVPALVLDHNVMVNEALEKLKRKARYRPIDFELLPEKFTIPQLRNLYEAIYRSDIDRRNFRKKILSMGVLEKLDEKDKQNSKKGAFLYRFDTEKYQKKIVEGFDFEL